MYGRVSTGHKQAKSKRQYRVHIYSGVHSSIHTLPFSSVWQKPKKMAAAANNINSSMSTKFRLFPPVSRFVSFFYFFLLILRLSLSLSLSLYIYIDIPSKFFIYFHKKNLEIFCYPKLQALLLSLVSLFFS